MSGVMFDKILGRIREDGDEGGGGGGNTPRTITVHDINNLLGELTDAQMDGLHVGDIIYDDGIKGPYVETWWFVVSNEYHDYRYYLYLLRFGTTIPSSRSPIGGSNLDFDMRLYIRLSTPEEGRYWEDNGYVRKNFALTHSWNKTMDALVRYDWVENASFWKNGDYVQATDGLYLLVGSAGDPTRRFVKVDAEAVTEVIYKYAHSTVYYDYYETRTTYLRTPAVSITYAELKVLRDGGKLVPGTWYRITDYACTTTQQDTQSANHAFDIIVRADDTIHLNENAFAAHHEGDEYFANCKLEAWQLKYSLDNDTNRFAWADDENGKGVVYLMKDEWNNECPYDFKNIMFKRVKVSGEYVKGSYEAANFLYLGIPGDIPEVFDVEDESDTIWVYTFNGFDDLEDVAQVRDVSVKGMLTEDERFGGYPDKYHPSNGVMKARQAFQVVDDEDGHEVQLLNNIVFVQMYTMTYNYEVDGYDFNAGCYNMTIGAKRNEGLKFGAHCHDFTIGSGCYGSSFGSNCQYNTFGTDCYQNSFGNNCYYNSFGNSCYNNSFGNYCYNNSFGISCNNNSFGNGCFENTFGNYFQDNTFGNDCNDNSFGNGFQYNSFGNDCYSNSFGNDCRGNSFGNNCGGNSFGNSCSGNSFGNDCGGNSFGNYCQTITVFDGVQYCSVTGGISSSAPVKNAQILNGTAGASAQNKLTIGFAANKAYTQVAAKTTTGTLKIFNPADLIQ